MEHGDAGGPGGGRPWTWAVVAVTLLALAYSSGNYLGHLINLSLAARAGRPAPPSISWFQLVLLELPVWYAWLALSPAILYLSRRFPVLGPRLPRNLLVHVCAGAAAVALNTAAVQGVQQFLSPGTRFSLTYAERVAVALGRYGFFLFSVYCAIVAVQHAALYYRAYRTRALQAAQLEAQLANAQLDVLRMQLQPHFLFNAMNTVASLMTRDVPAAHATLARLGDLLRRSLDPGVGHETPLSDELDFLERYLAIQRTRFRDRLRVEVDVERSALEVAVPRLILQPLVENAIRHGVQEREGPGRITVRGRRAGGRLRLEVVDDGPGLREAHPEGYREGGIGLANTRARLAQLYGTDHRFAVENAEPRGVRVRLEFPARVAEPVAEFVEA